MCYTNTVCWERLSFWCELLIIFISSNRGNFERYPPSSSFFRSLRTLNSACLTASVCWMVWKQNCMCWMWRTWTLMSSRPTWTSVWWGRWWLMGPLGFPAANMASSSITYMVCSICICLQCANNRGEWWKAVYKIRSVVFSSKDIRRDRGDR